ncbi:MAG: Fe-S cluster assembly protein SufD, partial [Acidimicrobiia bacterium]
LRAWESFDGRPIPHEKEEPWRYTDLKRMKFDFEPFTPSVPSKITEMTQEEKDLVRSEGDRSGYVIQRDADVVFTELDPELESKGVILTDLRAAIEEHGSLVKEHLFNEINPSGPQENVFTALHGSLFVGGTFLYVPRGVSVPLAIESQRWIDEPARAIFPHTLIVLEEGAELVYFERFRSSPLESPSLSNGAVEIVGGAGAQITFVSLQEYGKDVWHFQTQRAISQRDVTLRSLVLTLGGRFSRVVTESVIRGLGCFSEMLGLYFADGDQHIDHRTLQNHVAGGSTSDLLYKGALKDTSRSVYSGLIRVEENAAKTDAYQVNRNLVLSDHAKAHSKPELEIKNNELRCTHGASVGQIDEEELFYLQSRGLDRASAERLIVYGFFQEVIERIRLEEIRNVLRDAVERKLG